MIELDFSGTEPNEERRDFEPIADGWHDVRVMAAEEVTASTGSIGVKLDMVVEDGPWAKRRIFDRIWFTEKSMAFARQKLEATGLPIPTGRFSLNPQELVGRRFAVRTAQEEYQGKMDAKVQAYDRRSDSGMAPTPAAEDWRTMVPAAPADDTDIPF